MVRKRWTPITLSPICRPRIQKFAQNHAQTHYITREELESAILKSLTAVIPNQSANPTNFGIPPAPNNGSKFQGDKKSLLGLVDANLVATFEGEAGERFDGNSSRALEEILWTHYGQPKLSL
jgi:hypothetical protein